MGKTSYRDLAFAQGEFFSVVGGQKESLRIILMYYMFEYWFWFTTTLLESLRRQNTHFRAPFRQTSYKDLVFARVEFLSVVGAQNESLRIILMYYMFKYWLGSQQLHQTHFGAKIPILGLDLGKLVIRT